MDFKKRYYAVGELETLDSIRDLLHYAKRRHGDRVAYRQIESRTEESALSFRGLSDLVDELGTALLARGLGGCHLALLGETSVEWIIAFLAVMNGVGVAVPLDRELDDKTLTRQINLSDTEAVICSGGQLKRLLRVLPDCPKVRQVILIRPKAQSLAEAENSGGVELLRFASLLKEGRTLLKNGDERFLKAPIDVHALSLLVFTSGTTGANKGVMLSHGNLMCVLKGAKQLLSFPRTSLSILPVNHTYELTCHILAGIAVGTTISISDDLKHALKNLNHFEPEMTCMVPTILDLIQRKISIDVKKNHLEKHLQYGVWFSNFIRRFGIDRRRVYFKPILLNFGGELRKVICGGAPLRPEVERYFEELGITVMNGYGITECAPLVAVNGDRLRRKGSVGHVLPGCEVRIASPDANGNGEIQVRGGNVMLGYYKSPKDTAQVMTEDGWFRTGDLGHLDKDRFLYVNGRLKNLIILSNGKNVCPEEVEEVLQASIPYITESVVHADEAGTGIYAICYLDPEYCAQNGVTDKHDWLMRDIERFNRKIPSFKRITDVMIREETFVKTSTRKIKRFEVLKEGKKSHA